MLNRAIRYTPIITFIKKNKIKNILEVGSGSSGLGEFLEDKFVGCDIHFARNINKNLIPVISSALNLPFEDNSFELVVALDLLEHIEERNREKVIKELIRVSQNYIIISCPCGEKAELSENILMHWFKITKKAIPDWLLEHRQYGLPSENKIIEILKNIEEIEFSIVGNENILIHIAVITLESIQGISRITVLYKKFPKILNYLKYLNFRPYYRKTFLLKKR